MIRRKRIAFVFAAIAVVALACYLVTVWPYLTRERVGPPIGDLPQAVEGGTEPTSGQFVGHPEPSIVARFGRPTHRWRGHYGNPPTNYCRVYPDAFTLTYARPTGTLYLSFCEEQGRFVCFSSDWLPTGVVF